MTLQADGEPLSAVAFGLHSWLRGGRLTDWESDKLRGRSAKPRDSSLRYVVGSNRGRATTETDIRW